MVMNVYQNFASRDPSKVIRYLKRLIKRPSADFAPTIASVLKLAQDFEDNVGVCTWICHCLSNYALDESQAVHIVEKGGWKIVSNYLMIQDNELNIIYGILRRDVDSIRKR